MNLIEQLSAMNNKDFAIIIDHEKLYGNDRTRRMKIGNIDMGMLRDIWDRDVYTVSYSEEKHCFVIRIGDKQKTKMHLAGYKVIDTRLMQLGLINEKGITKVRNEMWPL